MKISQLLFNKLSNNINGIFKAIGLKKTNNLFYFCLGILVFYFSQFFITTKSLYFLVYFISGIFIYFYNRNLFQVLLSFLLISIFFDVGLGGRIFLLEPQFLKMGSGWWVTASTFLVVILIITLSINRKQEDIRLTINSADIFLFLFLIWNSLSFLLFININSFLGLIQLIETVMIYFLFRILINKNNIRFLVLIIISMIYFQAVIAVFQFLNKNPLGIIAEPVVQKQLQTLENVEGAHIFRSSGTFGHPNMLAAFFIAFSPFILLLNFTSHLIFLSNLIIIFAIILTFSRISWIFFIVEFLMTNFWRKILYISKSQIVYSKKIVTPLICFFLIFAVLPFFLIRIKNTPKSYTEFGSLGMRVKLTQEALNLMTKNPIWGVGLNRSLENYSLNPVTNIFTNFPTGSFYKIHNTFLEIGSESGIPGLILFIFFLSAVILRKPSKNKFIWFSSFMGFVGLLLVAYVNPFFHTPVFRQLIILAALILA